MEDLQNIVKCTKKICEIYKHCKQIIEEEQTNDLEALPCMSKIEVRDQLLEARELTDKMMNQVRDSSDFHVYNAISVRLIDLLGDACRVLGESSKAEQYYTECLSVIPDPLGSYYILASVHARNELGGLSYNRSQFEKAREWFEEAEDLYVKFKEKNGIVKNNFNILSEEEMEKQLEIHHSMTKLCLSQVYQALNDTIKAAIYCHETLKRELLSEYDPIDWALNSATLSQVFIERGLLKEARHHLAAASYVLDNLKPKLKETDEEKFRYRSADVSRCWAKYGINLLEQSKKQEDEEDQEDQEDLSSLKNKNLCFDSLDVSKYEDQVVASNVVTFEDAREVFLFTQKHLNKAKEYYTLEDRASDHSQIVRDHSRLFSLLEAFETDEERHLKMMRKRSNMLEVVVKELNPRYYMDECRQIWFELGVIYHDMMQIRYQRVKDSSEVPAPQELLKINSLSDTSVAYFNKLLDTFKDKKTNKLPDLLPENLMVPTILTHFFLGRLYHKYITQDRRRQIENTTKAYECFKYVVDYCEKSEKARDITGEKLNISKEMMTLLSMKALQL